MGGLQNGLRGVPLVFAFALIGFFGLHASHAATYVSSKEAETGVLAGGYSVGDPTGASGGASVKFGTASPTSPPGSMDPPAGSTLIRDLTRASNWDSESGATLTEPVGTGPSGLAVLRNTLVDGQTGASSGQPSERNDLQGGDVPLGSTRWMVWYERFVELPTTSLDRWQILGPNEIHGETLDQATAMPEVSPAKTRRLNANAGRPTTRYFEVGPIVLGQWYQMKFGIHYTQGNDGWIELWRDGQKIVRNDGPTTTENADGYWKFGNYRNADINGRTVYDISGCKVYGQ